MGTIQRPRVNGEICEEGSKKERVLGVWRLDRATSQAVCRGIAPVRGGCRGVTLWLLVADVEGREAGVAKARFGLKVFGCLALAGVM